MDINKIEENIENKIEYFNEIESTHKYAKENVNSIHNCTIIIAEKQTGGIGTKGRVWYTGEGKNIAMTIVLKPNVKVMQLENLTVNIAKAVQKAISRLYNIQLNIKEPNDLLIDNKKICGILTEVSSIGEKVNYLLISMGFNVNEEDFDLEIQNIATSLKREYKTDFSREDIIIEIVKEIKRII